MNKRPPLGVTARATVERVVDGDTVDVTVHWPLRIRMRDCWAPETRGEQRPDGLASKEHLETLIPKGSRVVFSVDSSNAEALGDMLTFGRVVGLVWRAEEDISLSDLMIEAGHATKEKSSD